MNEILMARESRSLLVKEIHRGFPLLVIKANTPGTNKNSPQAFFLVDYFSEIVKEKFPVSKAEFFHSADGPFWLLEFSERKNYKANFIDIEDKHPLGRLIDLDFYFNPIKSESRLDLNFKPRKCLICSDVALHCVRSQKHSLEELNQKIRRIILEFLLENIRPLIDEAITMEAQLDPKFGLVTKVSSGSHPDMDYSLLMRAKTIIIGPLLEMFALGYQEDLLPAFQKARLIGLEAEAKMYQATNNVNVYKGLIFVFGIMLVALGNSLSNYSFDIFSRVKQIGVEVEKDFSNLSESTSGMKAYLEYGIKGIRGEVINALPNVRKALETLNDFSRETLLMTLIGLIRDVEDTVLLKRAESLDRYLYYRKLIGSITNFDEERIKEITRECIENNLSFGGSADLLIVTIFLKKVEGCLKLNYESDLSDWSL